MKQFKASTISALTSAGITVETPDDELRKAYFKVTSTPLPKGNIEDVRDALGGNPERILAEKAPKAAKAKTEKAPKAPKAPKEPKPAKVQETPEAAMARLKADPATADRWKRVRSVNEMGKKGPTVVTIVCDDRAEDGSEILRTIKVQDLFQVKYSAAFAKKAARKNRKKAPAAAPATPAAE